MTVKAHIILQRLSRYKSETSGNFPVSNYITPTSCDFPIIFVTDLFPTLNGRHGDLNHLDVEIVCRVGDKSATSRVVSL